MSKRRRCNRTSANTSWQKTLKGNDCPICLNWLREDLWSKMSLTMIRQQSVTHLERYCRTEWISVCYHACTLYLRAVIVGQHHIIMCLLCCRLNDTESLINSHLYRPRCIQVNTPLPSVCQCGDDSAPACVNENSIFDRSLPAVTYLTTMTDTCFHSGRSRYACSFTIISEPRNKHVEDNIFQVKGCVILHVICGMLNPLKKTKGTHWLNISYVSILRQSLGQNRNRK